MQLEHSYAPPFSSAKDPIAIAGYVANNIISGKMPILTWRDIQKGVIEDYTIIDVRTKQEFQLGAIPNAINIPVDEMRQRINEVPKDKPICIYCLVGLRGYLAQQILIGNGFENVYNLSGGYKIYKTIISLSHEINKENENTKPQYSSKPVMEKISKIRLK